MATNFFKDLPLDFIPHPVTGDVRPVVDDVAVKKSIINLIRTPKGSRPFRPEYGSNVGNYLFKNADIFTQYDLASDLKQTITQFETRVDVVKVGVTFQDNGVTIDITYKIKNKSTVSTLTTTIKKAS
jgi:phage baseplate assembly protein W